VTSLRLLCLALIALLPCLACASSSRHIPKPPAGSVGVAGDWAIQFFERADTFYEHLIRRRFNTLETFNDRVLRDHFQTPDAFIDYYAELAQTLHEAHFERTRPLEIEVEEFLFENRFVAQVQVRFLGEDRRPLRPGTTELVRLDHWERVEGQWWIKPRKL
jgi:UDP:flavonoid glycosyltransferase YjiC (YdhE family)